MTTEERNTKIVELAKQFEQDLIALHTDDPEFSYVLLLRNNAGYKDGVHGYSDSILGLLRFASVYWEGTQNPFVERHRGSPQEDIPEDVMEAKMRKAYTILKKISEDDDMDDIDKLVRDSLK